MAKVDSKKSRIVNMRLPVALYERALVAATTRSTRTGEFLDGEGNVSVPAYIKWIVVSYFESNRKGVKDGK